MRGAYVGSNQIRPAGTRRSGYNQRQLKGRRAHKHVQWLYSITTVPPFFSKDMNNAVLKRRHGIKIQTEWGHLHEEELEDIDFSMNRNEIVSRALQLKAYLCLNILYFFI